MNNTKAFELSKLIDNELKTEEDIKEWLSLNLAEYLEDGNLNAFVRSLEYVVKAKDNISNLSRKNRYISKQFICNFQRRGNSSI